MKSQRSYRFAAIPEWIVMNPTLDAVDVRVFAVLDRFDGAACFPSLASVAEKIGKSEDTVRRSIRALEAVGAVVVLPRAIAGRQTSNEYHLAGDAPLRGRPGMDATPGGGTDARGEGGMGATRSRASNDPEQEEPQPRLTPQGRVVAEQVIEEEFAAFYANYPRHEGRGHALKAYRAAIKKTSPNVLLDALATSIGHWKRERTEKRHIPLPATWLNAERWLDELDPPRPAVPAVKMMNGVPVTAHQGWLGR